MNPNITTCRHCQKEVARTAEKCPHCGGNAPGISNTAYANITLISIVIVAVLGLSMYRSCSKASSELEKAGTELKESADKAQKAMDDAQRNLDNLKRRYGQ